MRYFAGLDVSLHTTRVCVVDSEGATVLEATVPTDPKAIAKCLKAGRRRYRRIGIEAQSMAEWITIGLAKAGLPVICIESFHASRVLKARMNKTDTNDAQGIAELMRVGLYRTVHIKAPDSRNARALLTARSLVLAKALDVENAIKGLLRAEGLKLAPCKPSNLEEAVRRLAQRSSLMTILDPLLLVRRTLREQYERLDEAAVRLASEDAVCRRLMTVPGVGTIAALYFRAAVDVPERFTRSRTVGAHLGLTPIKRQSGLMEWTGRISRRGDRDARRALFSAAVSIMNPRTRPTKLKIWGQAVAARKGMMKALVAVARKLAALLHRMWIDQTDFKDLPTEA